jgi:hypothetical protein
MIDRELQSIEPIYEDPTEETLFWLAMGKKMTIVLNYADILKGLSL